MTGLDYFSAKKKLDDKFKQDIQELSVKFAFANNPFQEGDIITDGITTIEIFSISVMISQAKLPFCVYKGKQLTTNLTYRKGGTHNVEIYQSRKLKKIIKK